MYGEIRECGMGAFCDPYVSDGRFRPEGIVTKNTCETDIACKKDSDAEEILPQDGCEPNMICDNDLSDGFHTEPPKRYTEDGECVDEELL